MDEAFCVHAASAKTAMFTLVCIWESDPEEGIVCDEVKTVSAEAVATVRTTATVIRSIVAVGVFVLAVGFTDFAMCEKTLCIKSYESLVQQEYTTNKPKRRTNQRQSHFLGKYFEFISLKIRINKLRLRVGFRGKCIRWFAIAGIFRTLRAQTHFNLLAALCFTTCFLFFES